MKTFSSLLLLCLLLAPIAFLSNDSTMLARADDVDDEVVNGESVGNDDEIVTDAEEDEELEVAGGDDFDLGPSDDVTMFTVFPSHPNKVMPAGSVVTALVTVVNKGRAAVLVDRMDGSIRPLQDMKQSFQNLSTIYMADMVEAGQQASFTYKFMPSPRFEPADFGFVLEVSFKDDDGSHFSQQAHNTSVSIVEEEDDFDITTLLSYAVVVAIAVAAYFQFNASKAPAAKAASTPTETGTKASAQGNEWLADANTPKVNGRKKKD
eukprot:m.7360 g.7360  ORF g.7360 m.7360 type:complete len:264 (-) comp8805_c0_seq2:135-926(-)